MGTKKPVLRGVICIKVDMEYIKISDTSVPKKLLLEADPSEVKIGSYLPGAICFAAIDNNEIVGVCVVQEIATNMAEIFNISINPRHQKKGIGSKLLQFTLSELENKGFHE
ncbi:GNAT family N-acetyltransferase [Microbulbifer sp. 2304DJ12-6]|uniref:GNAT family N-acetyltransferase n=1 Tax=Microbulbifer sp. 2304DJ12-6 TaxID=3233340 RepID=UPI0039B07035